MLWQLETLYTRAKLCAMWWYSPCTAIHIVSMVLRVAVRLLSMTILWMCGSALCASTFDTILTAHFDEFLAYLFRSTEILCTNHQNSFVVYIWCILSIMNSFANTIFPIYSKHIVLVSPFGPVCNISVWRWQLRWSIPCRWAPQKRRITITVRMDIGYSLAKCMEFVLSHAQR